MSKTSTVKVSSFWAPFTIIMGILIALLFYYTGKPCKAPTASHHGHGTAAINENQDNTTSEYITITGPNGTVVKVSSKFTNLVDYISEEATTTGTYADKAAGQAWKNKFKEWRNKMSATNVTPSFTNFMDIIELSKVLNEN